MHENVNEKTKEDITVKNNINFIAQANFCMSMRKKLKVVSKYRTSLL